MRTRLIAFLLLMSLIMAYNVNAQPAPDTEMVAMGGGYEYMDVGFLSRTIQRSQQPTIKILVLPVAYASNSEEIDDAERAQNLADAESRRLQIQIACDQIIPPDRTCEIYLAPVFTSADVRTLPVDQFVPEDLAGVFFLGGDQAIAMQVLANSRLETALEDAYQRGATIGGTSAGAAIQSLPMIAGYSADHDMENGFEFGAVDFWKSTDLRGLSFGVPEAVVDQHFFQRGRLPRLLNTIVLPDAPHVGIGFDAYTGASIRNHTFVDQVFGRTAVMVLDAESYHAADSVRYIGTEHVISLRNVLFHLLPPGRFGYDIKKRETTSRHLIGRIDRDLENLQLPEGAGPIFIGGGLVESEFLAEAINHFVNSAGGSNARILVIASGYSGRGEAQIDAARYSSALMGVPSQTRVILSGSPEIEAIPSGITGIILVGRDQSRIQPDLFTVVRQAWLSGTPLLADNAGAAVIGKYYGALGPTPEDETEAERFTQDVLTQGSMPISAGFGFFEVMIEPVVIEDCRWGRLIALAYNHRAYPVIGVSKGTYLTVTPDAVQVFGRNPVAILDLSLASLSLGENRVFSITNGLLDIFGPGELLQFTPADSSASPIRAATPVLSTPTGSETSIPTEAALTIGTPTPIPPTQIVPTISAPRATATKEIIAIEEHYEDPTPTDIRLLRTMIILGVLMTLAIFIGVWINRAQINMR